MVHERDNAWTYLQLPLRQWGAGNVYLLVLYSWKLNIAENPIADYNKESPTNQEIHSGRFFTVQIFTC